MTDHGQRYSKVAAALHWAMAILIIANILIGLGFPDPLPGQKYSPKPLLPLHITIGMMLVILSFVRVGWRLTHQPPPHPPGMRKWEVTAASITHWAIYFMIVAMPLSGWLILSSHKRTTFLRGVAKEPWPRVPFLNRLSESVLHTWHENWVTVHVFLTEYLMVALLALHVGAVIKHHLIDRDPVLMRMIPWRRAATPEEPLP